jgi:hypothetical protein
MKTAYLLNQQKVLLVALAVAAIVAGSFIGSNPHVRASAHVRDEEDAATAQGKLQLGVTYVCPEDFNRKFKVLSCDAKRHCQVFIVNKAAPGGGNTTMMTEGAILDDIAHSDCHVEGAPPVTHNPQECSVDPAIAAAPKRGDSSEVATKKAIFARYQRRVEEGGLRAAGIDFESVQLGAPFANIRGVNFHSSAPVGSKIYPVKAQFNVCERYDTTLRRSKIDGRYDCFRDSFGTWVCANASGWRIVTTKDEKAPKWEGN